MPFTNVQIDLETLPRFDTVELRKIDARYPRLVLGVAIAAEIVALAGCVSIFSIEPEPRALLTSWPGLSIGLAVLVFASGLAWFVHKSASVIRFAVREHDVIVHSGVFWKRETIQPIRRIQHVEQLQGPLARRLGLSKLRLFSAGTGQFTFEIPGLDAETAARIRRTILDAREAAVGETPDRAAVTAAVRDAEEASRAAEPAPAKDD